MFSWTECIFYMFKILKALFEIILFEDCGNQWSLSRPMLSLIVINEKVTYIINLLNFVYICSVVYGSINKKQWIW